MRSMCVFHGIPLNKAYQSGFLMLADSCNGEEEVKVEEGMAGNDVAHVVGFFRIKCA